jgi:hypothetical protein
MIATLATSQKIDQKPIGRKLEPKCFQLTFLLGSGICMIGAVTANLGRQKMLKHFLMPVVLKCTATFFFYPVCPLPVRKKCKSIFKKEKEKEKVHNLLNSL